MARPGDIDHVEVILLDRAIEMRIDKVLPRRSPPMPQQSRLHMLQLERLAQQRIVKQLDLPDGEIIRRPPVGIDLIEKFC